MTQRPSRSRRALALGAAALLGSTASARAEEPSLLREGGLGAVAAVVSFVYAPVKLVYSVSGFALGTSAFLWTWGDRKVGKTVIVAAMKGDYVITPDHLRGSEDIRFAGD